MTVQHDDYKKLLIPDGVTLEPCPCCAADTELWQYSTSETAPTSKLVCCSNGEQFPPQDGALGGCGCVMYMPPQEFYKATIKAAISYWNEWAKAMCQQQRSRRWVRAHGD